MTHVSGSDPNNPQVTTETIEIKGTSQLDKANQKLTTLYRQTQNVKKEMQQIVASNNKIKYIHTAGYSATAPISGGTGFGGGKTGHTPASIHGTTDKDKAALGGPSTGTRTKSESYRNRCKPRLPSSTERNSTKTSKACSVN